jgi:TPR repeat protein
VVRKWAKWDLKSILAMWGQGVSLRLMKANPRLFLVLALSMSAMTRGDVISDLTARAEKGEAVAQLELAGIYAKGEGVAKDQAAAAQWVLKAAEQGDVNAQVQLGQRYLKGEGVAKSGDDAAKWFSKAAEQGSSEAQMALGGMFIAGKGVKKSSSEAAKWFMMAAEQGNAAAQCQIGRMHVTGAGVQQDDLEAYKWSSLAAAQGDVAAKKVLDFLGTRMSPIQIAEGQRLSRDLLEGNTSEKTLKLPEDLPEVLPTELPVEPE